MSPWDFEIDYDVLSPITFTTNGDLIDTLKERLHGQYMSLNNRILDFRVGYMKKIRHQAKKVIKL